MTVWQYRDQLPELSAEMFSGSIACLFCGTAMVALDKSMLEGKGLETKISVRLCPICGWWKAGFYELEDLQLGWQPALIYGAAASLKELDLTDIDTPLEEVRAYLAAKYESRFSINPRLMEETVGSVFQNMGYTVLVTAYSGDGGIDVILQCADGSTVGVQVKRYRELIEAEQIRALTGALVLRGFTRGIFVTTSTYRKGAKATADLSTVRGVPIELVDANRFYEMLKLCQIQLSDLKSSIPKQLLNVNYTMLGRIPFIGDPLDPMPY